MKSSLPRPRQASPTSNDGKEDGVGAATPDPERRCATPLYVTFIAAVVLTAAGGLCLFVAWVLECP